MTDAGPGPISGEEVHLREEADRAYRGLEDNSPRLALSGERVMAMLQDATRKAPLPALAVAFLLGAMFARRRL